jgi:nucleoside-diphosphate-sugar epimerase
MEKRVFVLTGATGFLGSHLMAALLTRGDRVIVLGRPLRETGLSERIAKLLDWFGLEDRAGKVEPIETDLLKPRLGLAQREYQALCVKTYQIIHCASDTRFSERNRLESASTNINSLKEMITLAKDSGAQFFHYVSTAYVAARTSSLCPETFGGNHEFANVYEETKAGAEKTVATRCTASAVPFTILRPSIVYGNSRTGRANRFNALYYHVKSLYYIRDIYLNDILRHGGRKAGKWGIHLADGETLHLPLRMFLAKQGYVNLVPVDYFVSAVLAILEKTESGKIYHVTSDAPKTTEELASYCESFLQMKGIQILCGGSPEEDSLNPAEALFNRFIEPYRPYLSDTRLFERRNTDLASTGFKPPEFTYDIFKRCMDYAISVDWGNKV